MSFWDFFTGSDGQSAANKLYRPGSLAASDAYAKGFGGEERAAQDAMATGSTTGSQYATDQVQKNPILGQLFGSGGALEQSTKMNKDLNESGYTLNNQDNDALGQVSGDIARQYGSQDKSLASSLANRGFGGGQSGAANASFAFSGGNKLEALAKAQTQIAQQRVQNTQNRIQANNQLMTSLGSQGANAINDQYGRQMQGAKYGQDVLNSNISANQKQMGMEQGQENEQFAQQQATKNPGLFDSIGEGLKQGIGSTFAKLSDPIGTAQKGVAAIGGLKGLM